MEQTHNKKTSKPYSPEFRERAVRLALEHHDEYRSEAALFTAIASKLGCSPDSLRVWVRQAQRDGGERPGQTSAEKARIKELERENRELRQANEFLKKGETIFRHWSEDNGRTRILPLLSAMQASPAGQRDGARPPLSQGSARTLSLKNIAVSSGSSRCAKCCKSPSLPIMNGAPSRAILIGRQRVQSLTLICASRSMLPGRTTANSTVPGRFGMFCDGRVRMLPAALWSG